MNKLTKLSILSATLITATTVPIALLNSGTEEEQTNIEQVAKPKSKFKIPSLTTKYIPQLSSASYIKVRYKDVECLKEYFGEINFADPKTQKSKPNDISNFSSNSQSCLLVEYYKQTYTDGKWWGGFRIIWAVKDESQGFITVTSSRTYKRSLWGNSSAYTLKKDSSKSSWSSSHIKEIRESVKNDAGLKNLIPPANSSLPGLSEADKYWGFDPNLKKACGDSDCEKTDGSMLQRSYYWEFAQGGKNDSVYSWTTGIDHWLKQIFDWGNLKNKISEIKGEWKQKINSK